MRLRLLIPFFFLALAVLACDSESWYSLSYVSRLGVDPKTPGRVMAEVAHVEGSTLSAVDRTEVFITDDEGETWTATDAAFMTTGDAYALQVSPGYRRVLLDGRVLWTFPRQGFIDFFYTSTDEGIEPSTFLPELGRAANVVSGDALFVSMGTEGVLVGPSPGTGSTRPWVLHQDIPTLTPMPQGFANSRDVIAVVLAALLIPPLPLLHAFFLSRTWRYLMPIGTAWRRAVLTSMGFTLLAGAAVAAWVLPLGWDIGYQSLVDLVGGIVVLVSIALTVVWGRAAQLPARKLWRSVGSAFLLSAIVPLGVSGVWTLWWAIGAFALGWLLFEGLARAYLRANNLLPEPKSPEGLSRVEGLALQALLIGGVLGGIAGVAGNFVSALVGTYELALLVSAAAAWLVATLAAAMLFRSTAARLQPDEAAFTAQRPGLPEMAARLAGGIAAWCVASAAFAFAVFAAQSSAAGWFHRLMTP